MKNISTKVVVKHRLVPARKNEVTMSHLTGKVIHVGYQKGSEGYPTIWVEDYAAPDALLPDTEVLDGARTRTFHVVGTGQNFPESWVYVGSAVVEDLDLALVWHVYEEPTFAGGRS